ncbi:MAG: hypothetical protein ACK2UK_01390 [Candidatus Promineifilaceae bacterium]
MSNNFDWKTEEEFDWDALPEDTPKNPTPERRRRFLSILVGVLFVAALVGGAARLITQRVDDNTQAMREDIISSHNLLRMAESEQDDELFFSLLSGRDATWTATQHELFQTQSLQDRAAFGLHLQPLELAAAEQEDQLAISFSPDLLTAEVATILPFETEIGNGLTETVMLENTSVYRLGSERWLLAPPDQAFWGDQASERGANISLTFPERDAEIARRLAGDLDRKLRELGEASNLQLDIKLSTDVQTLAGAARPQAAAENDGVLSLALPAPTLVGTPQDESGYQALFRGYASQMVTALIAHQVGYSCCEKLPFFQVLADYRLDELALKPWPAARVDYGRALDEQLQLHDLAELWQSDDPHDLYGEDGWRVFTIVDYLLDSVPASDGGAADLLQRELVRHDSFYGWLTGLLGQEGEFTTNTAINSKLTRGFWLRGYEQTLRTDAGWGEQMPEQLLYATCVRLPGDDTESQGATLNRFNPATNAWDTIYRTDRLLWTSPLPGDNLLLQQEFDYEMDSWATGIRQGDDLQLLQSEPDIYTVSFGQTDPEASGLSAFVFPDQGENATITWFDLANCSESVGCAHWEISGIPIWAPDGQQALFTSVPGVQIGLLQRELSTVLVDPSAGNSVLPIYLASRQQITGSGAATDVSSLSRVGNGHAPFWIDKQTIGYITGVSNAQWRQNNRVMAMDMGGSEPRELFSLSDLLAYIDRGNDTGRLFWIHYVMVHPANPDRLFPVVFSNLNQNAHVFSFTRSTGEIKPLMTAGFGANHSLTISPDGRYLVLGGVDLNGPGRANESALLQVYDLETDKLYPFLSLTADFPPFAIYDWSGDSRWLALFPDDNVLAAFSPGQELLQLFEAPSGDCGTPAWINQ